MLKICKTCTEKARIERLSDEQVEIDLDLKSLNFWRDLTPWDCDYANLEGTCRGCGQTTLLNTGDSAGYFDRAAFTTICRNVAKSKHLGAYDWGKKVTLPLKDLVGAVPSDQLQAAHG